jgi:hypothetical protein
MQRRQQIEQDARKKISDPYDVDYFAKKHGISFKDAAFASSTSIARAGTPLIGRHTI